jgi:predicted DNA-binding ribbon-helix-helix protein
MAAGSNLPVDDLLGVHARVLGFHGSITIERNFWKRLHTRSARELSDNVLFLNMYERSTRSFSPYII